MAGLCDSGPVLLSRKATVLALTAALSLGPVAPALAQAPAKGAATPEDDATKLTNDGLKALKAGKAEEARALLAKAYKLRPTYRLAADLGRAEVAAQKFKDAAEHLTTAMHDKPDNVPEADVKAWSDALAQATAQLGVLKINVRPKGAEVFVNGQSVGAAPLPGPLFVDPGQVLIEAKLEGYMGLRTTKTLAAGAEEAVDFQLHREGRVDVPGPSPTNPPTIFKGITLPIAIGGAALSAAGTVIGASLAIVSAVKASKSHALEEPDATCGATCKDQFDALQKEKVTFAGASMWSFIGAGAVLLGTSTYLVVQVINRPKQSASAGLVVRPDRVGATFTFQW
jgi:hypothetical protein